MRKPQSVTLAPWLEEFEAPTSLKHSQARLWYALKELHGGSPHRAVDVLLRGVCEFPMFILKDKTNFKFVPPAPPFRLRPPTTLSACNNLIKSVVRTIEQGSIAEAINILRRA